MKKYYITSDIHSFFSEFKKRLDELEFDINNNEHILIICGDAFDRGSEAKELLKFLLSIPEERLIYIKGNHEELINSYVESLNDINSDHFNQNFMIHRNNGTINTVAQLSGIDYFDYSILGKNLYKIIKNKLKDYFKLTDRCIDYFEFANFICVHG